MVTKNDLSSKDLLLILLYSPGIGEKYNEAISGRTRIIKMVFLFEKELYKEFFNTIKIEIPEFEPYDYGPFSKSLFDDLRFFTSINFIEAAETRIPLSTSEQYEFELDKSDIEDDEYSFIEPVGNVELEYKLTNIGESYVSKYLWKKFSANQHDALKRFKKNINVISLDSLLRYVYTKYPESASKSKIADKYL